MPRDEKETKKEKTGRSEEEVDWRKQMKEREERKQKLEQEIEALRKKNEEEVRILIQRAKVEELDEHMADRQVRDNDRGQHGAAPGVVSPLRV